MTEASNPTSSGEVPPLKRASYLLHVASAASFLDPDWTEVEGSGQFIRERYEFIWIMDRVLALFENEPRFQHFTCTGQTCLLEYYLSIRPEQFERIEQLVEEGRLLIGPWYMLRDPRLAGIEAMIRNLLIGLQTAEAIGRPMKVAYLPYLKELPGHLPQILRSFGIETALIARTSASQPLESTWKGIDGTQIVTGSYRAISLSRHWRDYRQTEAPYSASGHILLVSYMTSLAKNWEDDLFDNLHSVKAQFHDNAFHSNFVAYTRAIAAYAQTNTLPEIQSTGALLQENEAEQQLAISLEPFMAWADLLEPLADERHIRKSQLLLSRLWKTFYETPQSAFLEGPSYQMQALLKQAMLDIAAHVQTGSLAAKGNCACVVFNPTLTPKTKTLDLEDVELTAIDVPPLGYRAYPITVADSVPKSGPGLYQRELLTCVITPLHDGVLPLSTSVISCSSPHFRLSAIKLPEDSERDGMIVRGYNVTSEPQWVTLKPWRPFAAVEVVAMDETPTGGRLASESDGSIVFRAGPHRIVTFWLHD